MECHKRMQRLSLLKRGALYQTGWDSWLPVWWPGEQFVGVLQCSS